MSSSNSSSSSKQPSNVSSPSSSSATRLKEKVVQDIIDYVHNNKRKQLSTIVSPQVTKVKKEKVAKNRSINQYAGHIVDLTMLDEQWDLPGTPSYRKIRNMQQLFFEYNPNGFRLELYDHYDSMPTDYCAKCRCPFEYCAETVFGLMCTNYTKHELQLRVNRNNELSVEEVRTMFQNNYIELVYSKMIQNEVIWTLNGNEKKKIVLPKCIVTNSLRNLLAKYKEAKEDDKYINMYN